MQLFQIFDIKDQIPAVHLHYYGRIAWRFEPFQVCTDKLRRGFESGLSCGNTESGFYCSFHAIKTAIFSGANLKSLLKELDYYINLAETYKSNLIENILLIYRETVCSLIDNGHTTSIEAKHRPGDYDGHGGEILDDLVFFHKAIQAYWVGYSDRCRHFCVRSSTNLTPLGQFNTLLIKFYHGTETDCTFKRQNQHRNNLTSLPRFFLCICHLPLKLAGLNELDMLKKKKYAKCKEGVPAAISSMEYAAANSDWNFTNKLRLLEAEHRSLYQNHHDTVIALYDASIESAKRSGFIHEQGLACEKAGFYCKRENEKEKAWKYFTKARESYEEWGSIMKVDFIQKELDRLNRNI
jgi:hypothetical protein